MLVKEVMSSPACTVRADTPIKDALALLDEHTITALPVVDEHGRIQGVVSEADLIRDALLPDARRHLSYALTPTTVLPPHEVGEVMTPHVLSVESDADLAEAVEVMTTTGVKSLPVVDHDLVVVGVVSRRDVVRVLARPDLTIEADVDELFRNLGLEWLVDVRDGVVTITGPEGPETQGVANVVAGSVPGVTGVRVGQQRRGQTRKTR